MHAYSQLARQLTTQNFLSRNISERKPTPWALAKNMVRPFHHLHRPHYTTLPILIMSDSSPTHHVECVVSHSLSASCRSVACNFIGVEYCNFYLTAL